MSPQKNAGYDHNITIGNKFFQNVENFKKCVKTLQIKIAYMKKLRRI